MVYTIYHFELSFILWNNFNNHFLVKGTLEGDEVPLSNLATTVALQSNLEAPCIL